MEEGQYRESRVCRLLGNPVVYRMVALLAEQGPMTPGNLAKLAGRSVAAVSIHLAKLRTADLVRYETKGKQTRYWLKHPNETMALIRALQRVVKSSARLD